MLKIHLICLIVKFSLLDPPLLDFYELVDEKISLKVLFLV